MWCGARGRVPGAGSLAGVVPTPSTWHGLLRTHSMSRPRLPDGASDRAAACALSVHAGEPARALHSSCPSRPARALVSPAAARDRCFPAASRKPGHAGSSWSGGGPAGLASRAQTLLLRQACQMRLLSVMAQESANQAAAALSTASTTAKVFNDGLDPMATEAFVDELSDHAAAHLLDLILKKRAELDSGAEGDINIFETGETRIRLEDYEKLDANGDGLISREELENYINSQKAPTEAPSRDQLIMLATSAAVPFIGFGFMDNAIMIVAGELIESHIAAVLTVSTMGCAAIGNLISDVAGVGMGSYVESVARRLGFKEPALTPEQMAMSSCKFASNAGAASGVAFGCLLGMFPLLFFGYDESHKKEKAQAAAQA